MTGLHHAVLLLAIAVGTVRGQYENPPAPPVEDLPLTELSDPNFWVTTNQIWDETDSRICTYDKSSGVCKTNIGYFVHASGMTKEKIDDPAMQFYLRFQQREACHGSLSQSTEFEGGTQCAAVGVDWSRYPLSPVSQFDVSKLCRTVYTDGDRTDKPIGCANNYAPYSVETDEQWLQWQQCEPLDDVTLTDEPVLSKNECRRNIFMMQTGWNFTVLFNMADMILQNGNDCQKRYERIFDSVQKKNWDTVCENGTFPVIEGKHPVLVDLETSKQFYGTFENPLDPVFSGFQPPPPPPPFPPPSPPSPPPPPPVVIPVKTPSGTGFTTVSSTTSISVSLAAMLMALMMMLLLV